MKNQLNSLWGSTLIKVGSEPFIYLFVRKEMLTLADDSIQPICIIIGG